MRSWGRSLRPLTLAIALASGCIYLGGSLDRRATTQVSSADLASNTPPLPAFVVRVAAADLGLDEKQAKLVAQLSREADGAIRPIDDARAVLIEVLVRAVSDGDVRASASAAAANDVVATTDAAIPALRSIVVRLHDALDPVQRRLLVRSVEGRLSVWGRLWRANEVHPWIATLAAPSVDGAALAQDAHATSQLWAEGLVGEVRAKSPLSSLDDIGRRDLIERLRAGQ